MLRTSGRFHICNEIAVSGLIAAMSSLHLFEALVIIHITTGAVGLVSFWVPIVSRKGGTNHRRWGKIFTFLMLITGTVAVGISSTTLYAPAETHPHLATHPEFSDAGLISAIFGWMMLYLAILTINLAWQGWLAIKNRNAHANNRAWHNLAMQIVLLLASANCAWRGWLVDQPMMIGLSIVGFATVGTNLWFIYKPQPRQHDRIKEHIKALVGAGISVYTAFFAFGAVRLMPELALQTRTMGHPIGHWTDTDHLPPA